MYHLDIAVSALPKSAVEAPQCAITLPSFDTFISLALLVTLEHLAIDEILMPISSGLLELNNIVAEKLLSLSHDELLTMGANWAECPPWKTLDANGMDLAGFLLEFSHAWHRAPEPRHVYLSCSAA